jgi:fatty-acyl-CoA synthase
MKGLEEILGKWTNKTLADLFDQAVEKYGKEEAFVFNKERLTYREIDRRVADFAKGLLKLGIRKGDKVGIWLSNRPEWAIAEFAVAKIGAVMVPLSTRFRAFDLEYILRQSDSTTLIMMDVFLKNNYLQVIEEICPELRSGEPGRLESKKVPLLINVICLSEKKYPGVFSFRDVMDAGKDPSLDALLKKTQSSLKSNDVINIPYTSGTTGFPKGVMTTHEQYLGEIIAFCDRLTIEERERFLAAPPFFANFGNYFGILLPTLVGGCSIPVEFFDPEECLRLIEKEKITHFTGTPTMYLDILNHPDFAKYNLSSLRTGMTGASPASVQMINDVRSKMGIKAICNGYGMTENSGATTMTCGADSAEVMAKTTGKPLPGVEIKIVDLKIKRDLPKNQIGELCTRGWIVMKGYYKMEDETAKCFDENGWFHTTDLGYIDDEGNFVITGRIKDMFISGGTNVYPAEVENFLYTFRKINQVAVVGVPDERMGERGMAFVILREDQASSEKEILDFCKDKIANYKIPKYVKFVNEIPMAGVGKIQKFKLQELALEELKKRRTG